MLIPFLGDVIGHPPFHPAHKRARPWSVTTPVAVEERGTRCYRYPLATSLIATTTHHDRGTAGEENEA